VPLSVAVAVIVPRSSSSSSFGTRDTKAFTITYGSRGNLHYVQRNRETTLGLSFVKKVLVARPTYEN